MIFDSLMRAASVRHSSSHCEDIVYVEVVVFYRTLFIGVEDSVLRGSFYATITNILPHIGNVPKNTAAHHKPDTSNGYTQFFGRHIRAR